MKHCKKLKTLFLCLFTLLGIGMISFSSSSQVHATTLKRPIIDTVNRKGNSNATVTWRKVPGCTGYQIQYDKDVYYKNPQIITVRGENTLTKSVNFPLNQNTCLRVRAYHKTEAGVKTFSKWSTNVKLIQWNTKWKYANRSKIHKDWAVVYASRVADKKYKTIAINAGHGCNGGSSVRTLCHPDGSSKVTGGSTGAGATYATSINEGTNVRGMSEAAANLKIAIMLKNKLLKSGYNVLMLRQDSNTQLDNIARTVISNNNAHCHIAIHFDDTSYNKGAFYMSVPNISRYRNMEPVKSTWKKHHVLGNCLLSGFKHAGVKIWGSGKMAMDLTQTSYSTIASVDIEVGDRGTSTATSSLNKIANGLYYGILKLYK